MIGSPYAKQAKTYQKQAILTASPGQLVLMLYDGALKFLNQAGEAFADPDNPKCIERVHQGLHRAGEIIAELQANLDLEAGGEYAENLYRLYDYYGRRLMEANMTKSERPMREVEKLLKQIRDAWADMLASTPEENTKNFSQEKAANY